MKTLQNSLSALPLALALSFNPMGASAQETAQDNAPNDGFSFSCDAPNLRQAFIEENKDRYPQDVSQLSSLELALMQNEIAELYEQYVVDRVYPATVFVSTATAMEMPFGRGPITGEPPISRNMGGLGSGFIIDANQGLIVTNAHVVGEDAEGAAKLSITINFYDPSALNFVGEEVSAKLVGIDNSGAIDVALLQIDVDRPLTCVEFGNSDLASVGENVFAIGNPLGQGFSVSEGVISHTNRTYSSPFHEVLQTDTTINRGNSGGALFNYEGQVIGVNTAILSASGGSDGIGFSIPSNVVADTANKLNIFGEISRGWLGASLQDLNDDQKSGLSHGYQNGVLLNSVAPDSPAEKSGLENGDIILMIEGEVMETTSQMVRKIANYRPDTEIEIIVQRGDDILTLEVTLGDRNLGAPIAPNSDNDILPQPDDEPLPDGGAPPPDGDAPTPPTPDNDALPAPDNNAPVPDTAPSPAPGITRPAPNPNATPTLPPTAPSIPAPGRLDGMGMDPN